MLLSWTTRPVVALATGGAALLRGEAGSRVGEKPWLAMSTDWDFFFSLQDGWNKQRVSSQQPVAFALWLSVVKRG